MGTDIPIILWWWFVLFLLGTAFLPFTARLFSNFVDRGYPFAKVIGILFLSYGFFLLSHMKLVTLTLPTLLFILVIILLPFLTVFRKKTKDKGENLAVFLRSRWKLLLFEELFFLSALVFWSLVRGFAPEIHGLEKFMDFGFVNSILTNKNMPPLDMWLTRAPDFAGHFINYYYFGHLYSAVLTRLTSLDSAITYNLLIGTLFAFTIIGSFSIAINLFAPFAQRMKNSAKTLLTVGILAAFLVALSGNLHTIYLFTKGYPNDKPVPFWEILGPYNPNAYWYPNATRFIPNTIHEFPIYSFVVSDLHGHVLDIPFVLLTLALLLSLMLERGENPKSEIRNSKQIQNSNDRNLKHSTILSLEHWNLFRILNLEFRILFLGLLLAVMYMTNAWDGFIYLFLTGLVFLYKNYQKTKNHQRVFLETIFQGAIVLVSFVLFSLPFSSHFDVFVKSIGVVCPLAALSKTSFGPFLFEDAGTHCDRSQPYMFFLLWGFFIYNALGFFLLIILPAFRKKIGRDGFTNLLVSESRSEGNRFSPSDVFVVLLIIVSTLLLLFPEFFYAKDIYPVHYRANTMFKLGYQAFMMMQIAAAYIFFRVLFGQKNQTPKSRRPAVASVQIQSSWMRLLSFVWIIGFFIGFNLVGIYPYFAITSYYGGLKVYKGLDGLTWMKDQYPDDYNAILWLRSQIVTNTLPASSPVILEAVGESYTDYARVSSYTGLPTVLGWPVHEWLWRGSYDEPGRRIPLVEKMYTSTDSEEVKSLLRKYNVSYIFVGALERQKYPQLTEEVFRQVGSVAFESGETRIYKIQLL